MKNKRLWIWTGGVILLGAVFLFLNFRLAVSNTQAEKLIFTTDLGDNMPNPIQRSDRISLVLVGEGPLVGALQKSLTEKMGEAGIGEIEPVQELKPIYQNSVLVIKVGKSSPVWTPFFAMSDVPVHAGYASNGDTTFMEPIEKTHTSIGNPDPTILNMYAEYEINDRSLGLISRPGYHQYLADYLAQEIVAALEGLYNG